MKFKLISRKGTFGKLNVRSERHGEDKVPEVDLPVSWSGGKRELDMLAPTQDPKAKFSDFVWDKGGNVLVPFISPLAIHRKPDTVQVLIYDKGDNAAPLKFDGCTVKSIKVTINEKRNVQGSMTIQLHPEVDKDMARLTRLMDQEASFQCEAMQEDFFDQEPDEGEGKDEPEE